MVFEHLFPDSLLERKEWTAFFLAIIYSTISIILAKLLFPANSGIVSVIFVSIFLLPYFEGLLKRGERKERKARNLSFLDTLRDSKDSIKTYFFLFLGVYLTYMGYAFIAPSLGFDIGQVFREQLSIEGIRGAATASCTSGTFFCIFINNWWVLLACFLIGLIAGDGAVFFVVWNASTWGTIFGYRAIEAGVHGWGNPLLALLIIVLITLPHLVLEGGAYILAAIAGSIISDDIVEKTEEVEKFVIYFACAVLFFVMLYLVSRMLFVADVGLGLAAIAIVLGLLYGMHYVFENRRESLLFRYNYRIFLLAIGIFLLGAIVETFVLYNALPLREIYSYAYG